MKIFVTGASGFIGSALCNHLSDNGHDVTALIRSSFKTNTPQLRLESLSEILPIHLQGFDVVVHTAGLAHQLSAHQDNEQESQFQEVNTHLTTLLAKTCVEAEVPGLITLSSTKAVGEGSVGPSVEVMPLTPYGRSKRDAELALSTIQTESDIDILQLRIPLTFGIGVKGNFPSLVSLAKKGLPLPYTSLNAKRSYLYIENLMDFVSHCLTLETFPRSESGDTCLFVADKNAESLGDMLKALTLAQHQRVINVPITEGMINLFGKLLSQKRQQQLFQDSLVDATETYKQAKWQPKITSIEGIYQMFGKSS